MTYSPDQFRKVRAALRHFLLRQQNKQIEEWTAARQDRIRQLEARIAELDQQANPPKHVDTP